MEFLLRNKFTPSIKVKVTFSAMDAIEKYLNAIGAKKRKVYKRNKKEKAIKMTNIIIIVWQYIKSIIKKKYPFELSGIKQSINRRKKYTKGSPFMKKKDSDTIYFSLTCHKNAQKAE